MRVLVTGAGGFIGRPAADALEEAGHEVYRLVRSDPGARDGALRGGRTLVADLDDQKQVDRVLEVARPDAALHLAWYANPTDYLTQAWQNLASLERTLRLLRRLRDAGCHRVVLGGSCLEHGSDSAAARSPYAAAKRAAHAVAVGLPPEDFSVACAHIFWVYGPGEDPRRGVPSVVRSLLRGEALDVTLGTPLREYLHVDDVGSALRAVVESDVTGRVDIATGEPVPLRAVFAEIVKAVGGPDLLRWGARPSGPDSAFEVASDPSVLRTVTTWRPRHSLETGIAETVGWWRERLRTDAKEDPRNEEAFGR